MEPAVNQSQTSSPQLIDAYLTHQRLVSLARILLPTLIIIITTLALIPPEQVPMASLGDKVLHAGAFFSLAALVDTAFPNTGWSWKKFIGLTAYGLAIEIAQSFHPLRTFALDDLVADMAGQGIYVILIPLFIRLPVTRLRWQQSTEKI
ncbi:VanZ family protein [Parendozoicomonas haliclonae]|uniref:VanZ like family protein n=1 Tax=Parendozoicomonas haliclonae TaxID=1960125 RepID=A0A1X7AI50_9GAMM|nr:VanZ family protein [Parendozoicomonas haliclonae]SMA43846.1 VanZ like family protein [Parendozoicomonas haliclonae]